MPKKRDRDQDQTKTQILEVATKQFALNGLSGASINEIAALTATTKPMIYYYFGSKEGLYIAVLEAEYLAMRKHEDRIDIESIAPDEAIRCLVGFAFDYQEKNHHFVRLVTVENIHQGNNIRRSNIIQEHNTAIIEKIDRILKRGKDAGLFRSDAVAIEVHALITSFGFFRVSNRYTFEAIFKYDLRDLGRRNALKAMLGDAVIGYLKGQPTDQPTNSPPASAVPN